MKSNDLSILLIEDNNDDIRLIKKSLSASRSPHFIIESRENLTTGLERLKQGNIDIILLDLGLPDSAGIRTFQKVQAQAEDLPVIILTGLKDDQCAVEAVHSGAQDYLFKNHTQPDYIVRAIMYAIERKKIEKELKEARGQLENKVAERTKELEKTNTELKEQIAERKRAEDELITHRDHLEERIKERTAELTKANEELLAEIKERRKAENALKDSEEKLRMIVENMPVMLHAFDSSGSILAWNSECEKVTGFSAEEIIGNPQAAEMLYQKEDYHTYLKEQLIKHYDGNFRNLEGNIFCKTGDKKTVLWSNMSDLYPIPGWSSWAVGIDISDRKKAEEKLRASLAGKEVLLKEIHLRIKNNLQVINSLLSLQSRRISDVDSIDIFKECKNRINSISLVHEKLYESEDFANIDFGDYARVLAQQLFNSHSDKLPNVTLSMAVESIFLQVNKAIPCALILNELMMNSIKFGFPAGKKGEIKVEFYSPEKESVSLIISDNGVGLPEGFDIEVPGTLGMQIINALVRQLHGAIEIDRGKGTKFAVTFKVDMYRERKK